MEFQKKAWQREMSMSTLVDIRNYNDAGLRLEKSCKSSPCNAFVNDARKLSILDSLDFEIVL